MKAHSPSSRLLVVLLLSSAGLLDARAQDVGAPPAELPAIATLRDPFWPVGWTPPPVDTTPGSQPSKDVKGPVRWDEATRMLEPTALTLLPNGQYLAVLKGIGVVEVGDKIAVKYGGLIYRWEVKAITSEGIAPQRIGVSSPREN